MLVSVAMIQALYRSLPNSMSSEDKNRACMIAQVMATVSKIENIDFGDSIDIAKKWRGDVISSISPEQCEQEYLNTNLDCSSNNWLLWAVNEKTGCKLKLEEPQC